ncbi:MAG: hypothetical protein ONB05_06535 [candidate division KSB1 bacterium]|nr:hypothetical protein [candidate division KSB1 bacterium]
MPGIRIVVESIPGHTTVPEIIDAGVRAVIGDIIAALTKPLTEEEKSPKPPDSGRPSKSIFKGSLKEVNQFFYRRGWTDGSPIIPPTEEEVAEILTGTDLPRDYVVAKIMPRFGKATVEKIAINAVMAGALPTYMPILIAMVKATLDPRANFDWQYSSAASPGPLWIINGPIRNDLNINCGRGVFSPGDMPNTVIGRAIGLILKNIGGIRKGYEEMGGMGNPMKYTLVVGENEEASPWEPLHVEHGFKKEDNTITMFTSGNNFNQTTAYAGDIKGIMNGMVDSLKGRASWGPCFIISPIRAKTLAEAGWKKKDIKIFLSENVTAPYRPELERTGLAQEETSVRYLPYNIGDPVRLLRNVDDIMIVVAGGDWPGAGAVITGRGKTMTKIELPANWDKLVAKYKDVVPKYVLY